VTAREQHTLGNRILVAAFDGWNDAGEAASNAVAMLRGEGAYEPVFSVDPELYFDYQYTRPMMQADGEGGRFLKWPEATLYRPRKKAAIELWVLAGVEPARAWRGFTSELLDVALREDVTGLITIGSMMSDVPHTRPIDVTMTSENEALRLALELERSAYEGPTGIIGVLADAAEQTGIPAVSLWASVPHYVASHAPSPKATLALLEKLAELTGADVPRGTLETEAMAWEASIDAAAAEDEDMREYIRHLEENRDTVESPEASGDAIAKAFERYLRRDGDDPRGRR